MSLTSAFDGAIRTAVTADVVVLEHIARRPVMAIAAAHEPQLVGVLSKLKVIAKAQRKCRAHKVLLLESALALSWILSAFFEIGKFIRRPERTVHFTDCP